MMWAVLWATVYTATACTLFVVVYHALARWWDSSTGVNIMGLIGSLAITFDLALVFRAVKDRPDWLPWVAVALYLVIGSLVWWLLARMIHVQHAKPEANPEAKADAEADG